MNPPETYGKLVSVSSFLRGVIQKVARCGFVRVGFVRKRPDYEGQEAEFLLGISPTESQMKGPCRNLSGLRRGLCGNSWGGICCPI